MAKKTTRCCRECKGELPAPTPSYPRERVFCSPACKAKHKNRRMVRGGDIYNPLMCWRHDREAFDERSGRTILTRMIANWKTEDDALGIKSYDDTEAAIRLLLDQHHVTVQDLTTDKSLGLKKRRKD